MALIAIAALAYVTLIWIEGPSYVYFLLMFWALAAAPLLLAAHARSGSQALRRAALYVAIASFGLALVSASSTDYNAWSLLFAALGVAVPLYASYRAIRRVYAARPAPPTPQTSRGREAITFGVITAGTRRYRGMRKLISR